MFDAKKINNPYYFISELYRRLTGYLADLEDLDIKKSYETGSFVQAVLNWMELYSDKPLAETATEVKISRHVKVSYDGDDSKEPKWDHKPVCTVTMLYKNGYIGIGYAFCHIKKDRFDRKYGIELSTQRAEKMIEDKVCPLCEVTSSQRWEPKSWIDKERMPYWMLNSHIGAITRYRIAVETGLLVEDFFFELLRVLAKQDMVIKGDVLVSTD